MFYVSLNDSGLEMLEAGFGVKPACVHDPWVGYTGVCVWHCNQWRTYGLPGEPSDERWQGIWDDEDFASQTGVYQLRQFVEKLNPERFKGIVDRHQRQADFDSKTQRGYAALMIRDTK